MSDAQSNKAFFKDDELIQWLVNIFASKPASFYSEGIMSLTEKWKRMLDCYGDYFN
jgi:hypothetical protein